MDDLKSKKKFKFIGILVFVLAVVSAVILSSVVFLFLRDRTAPDLELVNGLSVSFGEKVELYDLIEKALDARSGVTLTFYIENEEEKSKTYTFNAIGDYTATVVASDLAGNKITKSTTISVYDTQAPTIFCTSELNCIETYVNTPVAYSDYLTANDDVDGNISGSIKIDDSNLNINQVGNYTVTATVSDSSQNITVKSVTVKVKPVPASSISLDIKILLLSYNESKKITPTVQPTDWAGQVKWSSSDTNIATVNADGEVMWKSNGTCTITALADDVQQECVVCCLGQPAS